MHAGVDLEYWKRLHREGRPDKMFAIASMALVAWACERESMTVALTIAACVVAVGIWRFRPFMPSDGHPLVRLLCDRPHEIYETSITWQAQRVFARFELSRYTTLTVWTRTGEKLAMQIPNERTDEINQRLARELPQLRRIA